MMSNATLNGINWESVTVDASPEELSDVADMLSEIGIQVEFSFELGELLILTDTIILGIVSNDVG
jgi:hypothetical protein